MHKHPPWPSGGQGGGQRSATHSAERGSGASASASDGLRDVIIRGRPMDGLTYRLAIRIVAAFSMPLSPTWTV